MPQEELRQVDLARLAGVTPTAARHAMRGKLTPAQTPDGKRVYLGHPLVTAYIDSPNPGRQRALRASEARQAPAAAPVLPGGGTVDPFAAALSAATLPAQVAGQVEARTAQALRALWQTTGGALPEGLDDLGALTLREIISKWGTLEALAAAVKASKAFADFQLAEVKAAERRGDLVSRRLVSGVMMPLLNVAFTRIVGEAPTALREQVIARVFSGGDDLAIDVEAMIRKELSGILEAARDRIVKELETMNASD